MRLLCLLLALFGYVAAGPLKDEVPLYGPSSRIIVPKDKPVTNEEFMQLLNKTELVFGGQFARPGSFPYHVFILYAKSDGGQYICGGSLLSQTHVLTAAHCVVDMQRPARVMVGSTNVNQRGGSAQWSDIHAAHGHPYYQHGSQSFHYDIAILQISPVRVGGAVGLTRILSNDQQLLAGGRAIISGFGTYAFYGQQSQTSDQLRYTELQIYKHDYCYRQWATFSRGTQLNNAQICAGGRGRGSGPGDSGGPLVVQSGNGLIQIGLVSFGPMDPQLMQYRQDEVPAVYTRVSQHCDFISRYSGNTASCR
ncbi:hypothetical protein QR680_013559 [Steinernema hermaphroditum]|uniref:Peptidase S1 domain-containing protein n=1 Tax=Steinernema hermaphroditum TaxID=289476 RepID=A0AA39M2K5_9BILA|nr:hypothetical protein QR680_013559 [Steinernema hermaphroditum]